MITTFSQPKQDRPDEAIRLTCANCKRRRRVKFFLTQSNRITKVCDTCRGKAVPDRREKTTLSKNPMSATVICECGVPVILREMGAHLKKHNREFCMITGVKPV